MNKIYIEISKLSDEFIKMCYGITQNENDIKNAVQELMLYFLQMNPETLKNIYIKDGIEGVKKYGAVVLKRALTSKRSNFYYKYKKYYTHVKTHTVKKEQIVYNIPTEINNSQWEKLEKIDKVLDNLHWYDKELFKLYYYEGNTLDSLAKKTSISRNSLFTTIDKVRTIIKENVNE